MDRQFTALKAAKELRSYREGRLGPTTRLLRDTVVQEGLNHGSLLDIGGGVGALTFELLDRGMASATVAEASAAYAAAATEEASRRGKGSLARIVRGDLLEISETLPVVHLVTLDRVVCCYPFYGPLLDVALRHATRGFALSYPRDRWPVRARLWLDNVKRARTSGFRTFVHPPRRIQETIEAAGFVLARRRLTFAWTVDLYVRPNGAEAPRGAGVGG